MTVFDEELKARLLAFQKANGLPATGTVGTETWTALSATTSEVVEISQVVPAAPAPAAPPAQGLPAELLRFSKIPGEGFGSGGGAGFGTGSATGRVVAGGTQLGEGTFFAAESGAVVSSASPVTAVGEVAVGEVAVAEGAVVTGGTFSWGAAAVGVAEGAALAVLGALVVYGTVYLVVEAQNAKPKPVRPGEEYPGTSLPGGTGDDPAYTPGAPTTPAQAPGTPTTPAHAPGSSGAPVEAPGVVDDPDECFQLIKKGVKHDHHVFPRQFRSEFMLIGIDIDEYTVTLNATEHIGANGIHTTLDWNGEWDEFFDDLPRRVTLPDGARSQWYSKAMKKALEMMQDAGIDRKRLHPYRK